MDTLSSNADLISRGSKAANEYLAHHGIKGMQWGVRRTAAQLGHATVKIGKATVKVAKGTANSVVKGRAKISSIRAKRAASKEVKKDTKKEELTDERRKIADAYKIASNTRSARTLSKHMGVLTDAELNKRIDRLKKENEVREMAAKERERGRSWISKSLENSAKTSFSNVTTYGMTKLGKHMVDGLLDSALSGSGGKDSGGSGGKDSGGSGSKGSKSSSSKGSSIDVKYNNKSYTRPSGKVKSNNRSYKSYGVSAINQFKNNKTYGSSQSVERKSFSFGDVAYDDLFDVD